MVGSQQLLDDQLLDEMFRAGSKTCNTVASVLEFVYLVHQY